MQSYDPVTSAQFGDRSIDLHFSPCGDMVRELSDLFAARGIDSRNGSVAEWP